MENKILNLFSHELQLTFSQIKSRLKVRTNLLAYWLNKMVKSKILDKTEGLYSLAESSEHLVPYLSENKSTLPVILIEIKEGKKVFLYERKKIPYKNKLSLPGGRLLIGESIIDGAKRIMKTKFNIDVKNTKIKSISLEHVKKNKIILYSFLLFLVSANYEGKVKLYDISKMKNKMLKSDYKIISSRNKKDIKIQTIFSKYS